MSDTTAPGLGELFNLMGGTNPLASISKSIEQFRRGVNDLFESVETFNATMRELNAVAQRVNRLLDDVEEPVRAFMPQVTRTVRAADAMIEQLSGPVEKVAPGLAHLADTLASPGLSRLPTDLNDFVAVLREFSSRMQPFMQIAESAGGIFGFRPLSGLRPSTARQSAPARATELAAPEKPVAKKTAAKRAPAAKKTAAKKAPAKKAPAKKAPAKRAAAKTTATKKTAAKKTGAKKTPARRPAGTLPAGRRS